MTEEEYIIATNRVRITMAIRLIGETTTGDEFGVSIGQKHSLTDTLHTIETRLFKKIGEIINE
jgi:hypothetical protein